MRNKTWLAAVLVAVAVSPALADSKGIVDYRQGVMRANAGHMAALKAIFIGGQKQFLSQAVVHGEAIAKLAGSIPDMFPSGSTHRNSNARPRIWNDWDDFTGRAQTLQRLADEFVKAARSNDTAAMRAAFLKMGREGCSGCHEKYRKD